MKQTQAIKLIRITTAPISLRLLIPGQPQYMASSGFDVSLISAEGDDWNYIENLHSFHVYKIDFSRQIDLKKDIIALIALVRLFKKIKPHIVHTHTPKAGLLGMVAARLCGVPVRIHTLAGMPLMTASGIKKKILTIAEKITFSASLKTWPNSKRLLHYILDHKMIAPSKAEMILNGSSNGIDLEKFHPDHINHDRISALKKQYHLSDEDFCFLAVGRMVKDKGIHEIVESFLNLFQNHSHLKLILLGPFEEADALSPQTIQTIQAHPAIIYVNWSDEVQNFMYMSNCFVHASHREGFPNVVLQAGAMGLPVICSDIPGNIDIIESEEEGYVYPVKNQKALEDKMLYVLNNLLEAKQKAERLQQKVIRFYERSAIHEAIKLRYVGLLKENNIDVSSIH